MKIKVAIFLTALSSIPFSWGTGEAPENGKQLATRVTALRAEMAPYLQTRKMRTLPRAIDQVISHAGNGSQIYSVGIAEIICKATKK